MALGCLAFTLLGFAGRLHWWLDLFSHFRPQLTLGLAASSLILFLGRKWLIGVLAAVGVVLNLTVLIPHLQGALPYHQSANAASTIRVVSLNLLQGNTKHEAVESFIRQSGADVLVFQEVSPKWGEVLRKLEDVYPKQLIRGRKDSKGAAFLARKPVRNVSFEVMPGQDQIGAVVAEVETPAGPFTIFGIHSHKPTSARGVVSQEKYLGWLAKRSSEMRAAGMQVIVMGDFNSTPWSAAIQKLLSESQLLDTSRGHTFGATWNRWLPHQLLIDQAFVSTDWRLVNRQVGPYVGSDHRPLILDLALTR